MASEQASQLEAVRRELAEHREKLLECVEELEAATQVIF